MEPFKVILMINIFGMKKMKRSEMIKRLREAFSKYENYEIIAERALSCVEEFGMLPSPIICGGEEPNQVYFLNEWEPEIDLSKDSSQNYKDNLFADKFVTVKDPGH